MVIYRKYIESFSIEFAEGSELLIDPEVPDTIFFWFSDFQIDIREVSCDDENFCFLILFIKLPFDKVVLSFWSDEHLSYFYHTRSL